MEIKGKVYEVGTTQQVTDTLKKRELIVEYIENPQYPDYLKFEAANDRCDLLDKLKVGDEVEVSFNLKGRKYTDKSGKVGYFNQLQIWRINVLSTERHTVGGHDVTFVPAPGDDDDLPF